MRTVSRPPFTRRCLPWLAALLSVALWPSSLHAAVIYRETFGVTAASQYHTVGWTYWSSIQSGSYPNQIDGPVEGPAAASNFNRGVISGQDGKPGNVGNVNAGPTVSTTQGYGMVRSTTNLDALGVKGLVFTEEFAIERPLYSIDAIEWHSMGGSSGSTPFIGTESLAIRIDGQWYITEPKAPGIFSNAAISNFSTNATLTRIELANAQWYTLSATLGSPFAIGTSAIPLPEGDISAFGLYLTTGIINRNINTIAFDTFTIHGTQMVPEPQSLAWFLMAGVGILVLRHRRLLR